MILILTSQAYQAVICNRSFLYLTSHLNNQCHQMWVFCCFLYSLVSFFRAFEPNLAKINIKHTFKKVCMHIDGKMCFLNDYIIFLNTRRSVLLRNVSSFSVILNFQKLTETCMKPLLCLWPLTVRLHWILEVVPLHSMEENFNAVSEIIKSK